MDEIARHEMGSTLGGGQAAVTVSNQPVFEAALLPPKEVRYLLVKMKSDGEASVFRIPEGLASTDWTDWRLPDFQSSQPLLDFALLRNQEVTDRSAPGSSAPRARYQIVPFNTYLERVRAHRETGKDQGLPGC